MSEVRKIAHNTFIQIAGKAISAIIGLTAFGLIARYLSQTGFGAFTTVYAFLAIFGILIDLGLQMTVTTLISDPKNDEDAILSNALTMRLLLSAIFLSLAALVVTSFPYAYNIKTGVMIAAIGFLFSSLTSTLISYFQKHLIMYQTVIAEVIAKVIYLGLLFMAINADFGLAGVIIATVIDSFLIFFIAFLFARRGVRLIIRFDRVIWKKILLTTWPIALTIALNLIYFKGDLIIMSLLRSQAEVGIYGAPYRVLEVLIALVYLFLGLTLPIMSAAAATNNLPRLKQILQSIFDFLLIISVPLIVGGLFVGERLMIFMAGEDFATSGVLLKILLIATGIIFIAGLFGYAVVALKQQTKMIKYYAINAALSIIAYLIFIPLYGYWAAAWITVISEFFILISAQVILKKTIDFSLRWYILKPITIATIAMSLVLAIFAGLHFSILIIIGALVYGITLYRFGGIDPIVVRQIFKLKSE